VPVRPGPVFPSADTRLLTETGQGKSTGLPVPLARQVTALREDLAAAQAMTHAAGGPSVGGTRLWEFLAPALSS
jgi:hypothetical protein